MRTQCGPLSIPGSWKLTLELAVGLWLSIGAASAATFVTFDAGGTDTLVAGINASGVVAGSYFDRTAEHTCIQHGFVRSADGTITTFDPDAGTNLVHTQTNGINDSGQVAGFFDEYDNNCVLVGTRGFIRNADGTIIYLDPPSGDGLQIAAINNAGTVTGFYFFDGKYHGMLRTANGKFTTFDAPHSIETYPNAINGDGIVVGNFSSKANRNRGFIRPAQGEIIVIKVP
ncbi:MAG: hypothetical protein JO056_13415, partial [Alphaproteobacteria bacterium]|nr:hypothetical protein [Alphaproteobacteria bacterium]